MGARVDPLRAQGFSDRVILAALEAEMAELRAETAALKRELHGLMVRAGFGPEEAAALIIRRWG